MDSGTYTADLSTLDGEHDLLLPGVRSRRLRQLDGAQISWWSDTQYFNTTGPISATVTDHTQSQVRLAVSGITADKWSYSYRKSGSGAWSKCKPHDSSTTSITVGGLESGTAYDFHVYNGDSCQFHDQVTVQAHTIRCPRARSGSPRRR